MSVQVRNKIIEDLFISKDFNECIEKMNPEDLREDLKAEVILALLKMNEDKLIRIHETGGLRFYAVRIILNLIQSKTSPFFKKYRGHIYEFQDNLSTWEANENEYSKPGFDKRKWIGSEEEEFDKRLVLELREERVFKIIEELYWYDKEILKLYIKLGTYRLIEKETGIPWRSCYDTIQASISKIRYELRKSNKN